MSNISITFSIWHICLLFVALLVGVLIGCFLTLCIFKWAFANKVSFRGKRNGRKFRRRQKKTNSGPVVIADDYDDESNEDDEAEEQDVQEEQETSKPAEPEAQSDSGYRQGSVLKTKMNRSNVLNMFDLEAAADGVSVEEKLKARQSKEDASYSILKNGKKKE